MKIFKRIVLAIFILAFTAIIFRGWLYRHLVTYRSTGTRSGYIVTDPKLITCIEERSKGNEVPGIQEVIKQSLAVTSDVLIYRASKNENDPNLLVHTGTAHCVGYASLFSSSCNYLLKKYNLGSSWTAKPQVGKLYFLSFNIHQYFTSAFFRDHDFVIIENSKTGKVFAVDPTVNDYFSIDFITYSK